METKADSRHVSRKESESADPSRCLIARHLEHRVVKIGIRLLIPVCMQWISKKPRDETIGGRAWGNFPGRDAGEQTILGRHGVFLGSFLHKHTSHTITNGEAVGLGH